MNETHKRLEELLFASTSQTFPVADRIELNALLRSNSDARTFAARHLALDALLAESLAASEHSNAFKPIPLSAGHALKRPNWLARAAAWIGAFHLFSHNAKAATFIVMKKSVTSVTAAILLLGGSGIYVIHRNNESSRARVGIMETEIQLLNDQLGIQTTRSSNRQAGATDTGKPVSIARILVVFGGDNTIDAQERIILEQFRNQIAAMDAESLKSLLLDAEKISSPIHGRVAEMIMAELISKDPAEATQIASQLIGRGPQFQFLLSASAAKAFKAWLTKDPAAADAWYVATVAAGGLNSRNIAPNGLEDLAIDRSFARLRFAAQVLTNPTEAAAMLATMLPADVTEALQEVTDPNALRQILPKLPPAQQGPAAEGAIKAMAATDLNAAFIWAKSLAMNDQARDALMATGIEAAVASGKLDLAGVSERSKDLNLDAARLSELLVSAATDVSLIPQLRENHIDPNNRVVWDRVAERIDWLRKEAPAAMTESMVGDYLGKLSYESHNLERSLEAYQNEVKRQGQIDPDLTIAFAFHLQIQENDDAKAAALDLLNKLPPGEKRDEAIRNTELNR